MIIKNEGFKNNKTYQKSQFWDNQKGMATNPRISCGKFSQLFETFVGVSVNQVQSNYYLI